jgi:3-oxoacyl-[acyl-carrier protein] reductase
MFRLDGKTALVTGASRGIGRATALALSTAGAYVLAHFGSSQQDVDTLVANIRHSGGKADAIGVNLAAPDAATELATKVRRLVGDHLDVFVANAGISKAGRIEDHTVQDFDNLFATNVRAPFFILQQPLPSFGEGSSVIVLTSLAARVPPELLASRVRLCCRLMPQRRERSKPSSSIGLRSSGPGVSA